MTAQIPHAATHSSLDLFQKPSILVNFDSGIEQQLFPVGSLDGPNLEFSLETDRHLFIDLQNIYLNLTVKLIKGDHVNLDADDNVVFTNNIMHSLFSNCDVALNSELVYSSNGHYPHKAMIQSETSFSGGTKATLLECQGYSYEETPGTFTGDTFVNRKAKTATSSEVHLYGKLAVDLLNCDRLLIPNTNVRITLIKSNPNFCLISSEDNPEHKRYRVKFMKASLHVRQMNVSEPVHRSINNALAKGPARYIYPDIHTRTFIIAAGQNHFIKENIFSNESVRRICIAMNRNAHFTGTLETNPFNYQKFDLKEIKISRGGQTIVSLNTESDVVPYCNTFNSLNFDQDGPGIPLSQYPNHYILAFDLTSTLQADTEVYYPEIVGAGLRVELYFNKPVEHTLEAIFLAEKLSTVFIHNDGRVLKE